MPSVSIIVPNFNHSSFLRKRLDSIFNQTYQDFEVILLDDCSTDNSVELLKQYSTHASVSHFIVNTQNSGNTFKQWSKGIELTRGELIWIAESDDVCELNFLEKLVPIVQQDNKVGLVYCQSWSISDSGEKTGNWIDHTNDFNTTLFNSDFRYKGSDFVDEFLIYKNVLPNASAIVFRKSVYEQSKGVNLKIKYCGDWFLWLKMAILYDVCFVSESLNHFRRHENSVIYKALNTVHSDQYFLQKSDIKMRKYFALWLKTQSSDFNSIIEKNNSCIDKVNIEESLFYIYSGTLFKSFLFSIRYFFLTLQPGLLLVPFKRTLFLSLRITKRIINKL
jgi:glycosyltransferase involved in cell wall biosynthesis